jgi:hypothetical protein
VTSTELWLWQEDAPAALVAMLGPARALVELVALEERAQRYSVDSKSPTPGGPTSPKRVCASRITRSDRPTRRRRHRGHHLRLEPADLRVRPWRTSGGLGPCDRHLLRPPLAPTHHPGSGHQARHSLASDVRAASISPARILGGP